MNTVVERDEAWMRRAIECARRGWGQTHPNPMVGAVVVESDQLLSEGWHECAGKPHAEPNALNPLHGRDLSRATLYVTLEPCSTWGRTPPCTERILQSGIKRVVVGARDPNPAHAGRAFGLLREKGIEVVGPVLERECNDLNLIFNHWIVQKKPFIAGKLALTIDGCIATRAGHSQWITGPVARQDVMQWRRYFPAIAVGSETILNDNSALTARIADQPVSCGVRLILDRRFRLEKQSELTVFSDSFAAKTVLFIDQKRLQEKTESVKLFQEKGVQFVPVKEGDSLAAMEAYAVEHGLCGVYLEGGAGVLSAALEQKRLDYLFIYQAPKILGDREARRGFSGRSPLEMSDALTLDDVHQTVLDPDHLVRGKVVYP
jgi:diaminohydroxyphosphoribosylaminopyrimidine deaminase/5-amino-6-(5-phosphoribosylamino)uracil reductase